MKIGDIVVITVEVPSGVHNVESVYGETGVIVDEDTVYNCWEVATGNPNTTMWWFTESELRPATAEEIADRLRYVLMERRIV